MAQFTNPLGQANPAFTSVNPSGTSPDQSIATIAGVKQGELNRQHEAKQFNAQLAQQNHQAFLQRQHEMKMAGRNMRFDMVRGEMARRNEDFWKERAERLSREQIQINRDIEMRRIRSNEKVEGLRMDRAEDAALAADERAKRADLRRQRALAERARTSRAELDPLIQARARKEAEAASLDVFRRLLDHTLDAEGTKELTSYLQSEVLHNHGLDERIREMGQHLVSWTQTHKIPTGGLDRWANQTPEGRAAVDDMAARLTGVVLGPDASLELRGQVRDQLKMVVRLAAEAAETPEDFRDPSGLPPIGIPVQGAVRVTGEEQQRRARQALADQILRLAETEGVNADILAGALTSLGETMSLGLEMSGAEALQDAVEQGDAEAGIRTPERVQIENQGARLILGEMTRALDYEGSDRNYLRRLRPGDSAETINGFVQNLVSGMTSDPQYAASLLGGGHVDAEGNVRADPDLVQAVEEFFREIGGGPQSLGGSGISGVDAQEIADNLTEIWTMQMTGELTKMGSPEMGDAQGLTAMEVLQRYSGPYGEGRREAVGAEMEELDRQIAEIKARHEAEGPLDLATAREEELADLAEARRRLRQRGGRRGEKGGR